MFPSTEARSPDKKPGACMDLCEDQNTEEPYHSLSLAPLYQISPGSALSPFQLNPGDGG